MAPLPLINDALMMNIRPFQIKVVIIFFASYCIWLIKWWFFFPTWDLHLQMNFINFLPLIILILIILFFSNLVALAFDQWCICDDFGTFANQFCCDQCFIGFFWWVNQGFFPFNLCKHFFVASHIKSTYSYWSYVPF